MRIIYLLWALWLAVSVTAAKSSKSSLSSNKKEKLAIEDFSSSREKSKAGNQGSTWLDNTTEALDIGESLGNISKSLQTILPIAKLLVSNVDNMQDLIEEMQIDISFFKKLVPVVSILKLAVEKIDPDLMRKPMKMTN